MEAEREAHGANGIIVVKKQTNKKTHNSKRGGGGGAVGCQLPPMRTASELYRELPCCLWAPPCPLPPERVLVATPVGPTHVNTVLF